jgi:hypothetical protein
LLPRIRELHSRNTKTLDLRRKRQKGTDVPIARSQATSRRTANFYIPIFDQQGGSRRQKTIERGRKRAAEETKRGGLILRKPQKHLPLSLPIFLRQKETGQVDQDQIQCNVTFAQFASWYTKQQNGCGMTLNTLNLNLNDEIIFDSGATDHIFYNEKFLINLDLTKNTKHVLVANGTKVQIDGIGNYSIFSKEIKNVLYVKSFSTNLISIKKLTQELNCNVIFSSSNITF